jgi:hypothetical protein
MYMRLIVLVAIGILFLGYAYQTGMIGKRITPAAVTPSPYVYSFSTDGILEETASPETSSSPYWWVDSGGRFMIANGVGQTIIGDVSPSDRWYLTYHDSNPEDTDGGLHPQNIFRLVARSTWHNVRIEMHFKIIADHFSESSNRNESNGVLLMSRYTDTGDTLYYAGIRVDGTAVIKKKYHGTYYTMAQNRIFPGIYTQSTSPNLLPHNQWIGLRNETISEGNGSVSVRLYLQNDDGSWREIAEAHDDGKQFDGTPAIEGVLPIGIRTDFMDVQFQNFRAESIN